MANDFWGPYFKQKIAEAEATATRESAATRFREGFENSVGHAQKSWDDGFPMVVVALHLDHQVLEGLGAPDMQNLAEIWTVALAEITNIGWQLHTWSVTADEHYGYTALPLFERPVE